MRRLGRLPSPAPAMVVALGALILSVGGNVTAAVLITSADIKDNTIRGVDVRDGALTSADIKNSTIKGVDIRDGTIKSADVANGSLRGADVAGNSLTGVDLDESTLAQVPSAASAMNAQNAGRVDGLDANSLTRVARMGTGAPLVLTTAAQTFGTALSITAPRAGFVMIHGGITIANSGCTSGCSVLGRVRHIESGATSVPAEESIGQAFANMSHAWVFPVNAGVNTFDIRIARFTGNGTISGSFAELAAIYSPFGSTGAGTLATDTATSSSKSLGGN
jgi:hypothetical protein